MFDALLKSKFYLKCKSNLKLTRTRIEMIRNKRKAIQKYLRNDVADLIRTGLDIYAYDRAKGLLVEVNRSNCYEFIEQCCLHISNNLSAMNKQRECPEDCREAISSLMFAAARFADLPELREIRKIFTERYTNSFDCYVKKEFEENLESGTPSKDMKIQLLQDIAAESGLEWNSKALENKLYHEPACTKDYVKEINGNAHSRQDSTDRPVQRKDFRGTESEFTNPRDANEERQPIKTPTLPPILPKRLDEVPPMKDIQVDTIQKAEIKNVPESPKSDQTEEKPKDEPLKYAKIPPPYTKPESNPIIEEKTLPPKPIPKSVRRRLPSQEKNSVQETNREKARQGQRILKFLDGDKRDDEEKVMDKLLLRYSQKNKSTLEKGKSVSDFDPIEPVKVHKNRNRPIPTRMSSLPHEPKSPIETPKRHARAFSLEPEMLGNGHVHPKLPEYDEFVARLASLRGD